MNNPSRNAQGQFARYTAAWISGKVVPHFIGYGDVVFTDNRGNVVSETTPGAIKVLKELLPFILDVITAAKADGLDMTYSAVFRTMDEQIGFRLRNVVDKSKVKTVNGVLMPVDAAAEEFIMTAPNTDGNGKATGFFYPVVGVPGTSNHQDGGAIGGAVDWDVSGHTDRYEWFCRHGEAQGWVRMVKTEIWHWEHRPGWHIFAMVPKGHASWPAFINA